jgi:hypothetical protein
MSDDLVERVGRELARTGYAFAGIDLTDPYTADADYWNSQARAAIAVCMEEAAKVAGKWQQMYFEDEKVHSSNITEYIVADIRALVQK